MNWTEIKTVSMSTLRANEWRLYNPLEPIPSGLLSRIIADKLTFGWRSRRMMKGVATSHVAAEWFRFAAHAIAIRPTFQLAYFRRAINGTINSGGVKRPEYVGFDAHGDSVVYDWWYGIVDSEILLRLNPSHTAGKMLQGILIFDVAEHSTDADTQQGISLSRRLLTESLAKGTDSRGLTDKAQECLKEINSKYQTDSKTSPESAGN